MTTEAEREIREALDLTRNIEGYLETARRELDSAFVDCTLHAQLALHVARYLRKASPENISALLADRDEREAKLREEIDRLTRERDALAKDAARYRWLADRPWNVTCDIDGFADWAVTFFSEYGTTEDEDDLDAAIDACGVVALANTAESAAKAREMHGDYRSASCDDVARAVDREMALRAERDALAKDAERLDWLDAQWRDPIHLEISARSVKGDGYVRECVLFMPKGEVRAADVRSTIDAAMAKNAEERSR